MTLSPKDLPKPLRGAWVLALLAGSVLAAAGAGYVVMQRVATQVVNERWDEKFQAQVTTIATTAAVAAGREAAATIARDQVGPLAEHVAELQSRMDRHEPRDDASNQRLEAAVAACCPATPAGTWGPALPEDRRRRRAPLAGHVPGGG